MNIKKRQRYEWKQFPQNIHRFGGISRFPIYYSFGGSDDNGTLSFFNSKDEINFTRVNIRPIPAMLYVYIIKIIKFTKTIDLIYSENQEEIDRYNLLMRLDG